MNIPQTGKKKALIIVDVQKGFLNARNEYIVANILELLKTIPYDRYVLATFHTEEGSLWEKQQGWTFPRGEKTQTVPEILGALGTFDPIMVEKETRSTFKGDKDIASLLREVAIEEVHVAGLETDDCVLATCFESFDLGFLTYAIEECCESADSQRHVRGIELLRTENMTNNSVVRNEA